MACITQDHDMVKQISLNSLTPGRYSCGRIYDFLMYFKGKYLKNFLWTFSHRWMPQDANDDTNALPQRSTYELNVQLIVS